MPGGMTDLAALKTNLALQAGFCRSSGSPFSALVQEAIGRRVDDGAPYGNILRPWADRTVRQIFDDAVALRLMGAFHYLALSGRAPELAALYPPQTTTPDPDALEAALAEAAAQHDDVISSFMASPPQTNEVGRSLCLVGGFLTVAAETGLSLRCLELGASAGLNMNWDRYRYTFGDGAGWGDPASPVRLSGDWQGASPPMVEATVVERAACDQNPIDVTDPDQALWLQSYVWADQTHRLERLRAAIDLKRRTGDVPERADAADWSEARLRPRPGVATVVYYSSFIMYPPEAIRQRILAAIQAAGAAATTAAPFACLAMEPNPQDAAGPDVVQLTIWPGGETRRLADVHPHGAKVNWLAQS